LEAFEKKIKAELTKSEVMHVDETSRKGKRRRVKRVKKRIFLGRLWE
jgi:hypothetical protein